MAQSPVSASQPQALQAYLSSLRHCGLNIARDINEEARDRRLTVTVRNYRFVFEMACHNSSRSRNNQDERWSVG